MYKLFSVTVTLLCLASAVISLGDTADDGTSINGKTTDLPVINDLTTSAVEPQPVTPDTTTVKPPTTLPPNTTTPTPSTTPTPKTTTIVPTTTAKPTNATTTTVAPPPTTTPKNATTTIAPATTTAPPHHADRKFDGPSFIGGIVLASGLMAIGFVAWKFYKARTERNYHTL